MGQRTQFRGQTIPQRVTRAALFTPTPTECREYSHRPRRTPDERTWRWATRARKHGQNLFGGCDLPLPGR
eukprot:11197403-Lingulodinium_polyedra.AAC.1